VIFLETLISFEVLPFSFSIFEYFGSSRCHRFFSLPSFEAAFDLSRFGGSAET